MTDVGFYSDGYKENLEGAGAGELWYYRNRKEVGIHLSLGVHSTVFQAEVTALLVCTCEKNFSKETRDQRICIYTDSPAFISNKFNFKIV